MAWGRLSGRLIGMSGRWRCSGTQVLENQMRVAETATAIMLRQAGENSVLANIATSVSESLTQVMRWVYWWNSTEALPEMVTDGQVLVELNTDFGVTRDAERRAGGRGEGVEGRRDVPGLDAGVVPQAGNSAGGAHQRG